MSDKEQATTFIEVNTGHHADSAACRVDESADMVPSRLSALVLAAIKGKISVVALFDKPTTCSSQLA